MGIEDAYLGYDFLDGAGGGRPERGGGAVGLAAGAHAAGPPGEPRRPRQSGGTAAPLHHHRRQHRGPRGRRRRPPRRRPAPPAARLRLLHQAPDQRDGVREGQPVREQPVEHHAQRRRPGRRDLRRQLQQVHLQRQRLRRGAQIRRLHPPLSSPSPPIRSGRTRGAAWRGESELGVARGATWGGRRGWFNAAASRISAQSQPSDPVHLGCCTGSTALYAMQGGSPTDAHDVKN